MDHTNPVRIFLYRSFIFFLAKENRTKRKRPHHEPSGFACASPCRTDAPKLTLLAAGFRQSSRLFRPVQ